MTSKLLLATLVALLLSTTISMTHSLHLDVQNESSTIISQSKNFTVQANDTVILPCVVRNLPENKFAIWNQCDDPACNQLRFLLTVNKDNFVEDLRFRVISSSSSQSSKDAVKRENKDDESESSSSEVNSWNLEIRKFAKADQGCYQCQLNTGSTFNMKTIHYCLKLQTKVITDMKKITINVNMPIRLKCLSDENVRLSHIKWYKNGHRVKSSTSAANHNSSSNKFHEKHQPITIEKKPPPSTSNTNTAGGNNNNNNNNFLSTTLSIKHATLEDSGVYACKFGHLSEQIEVDVVVGGANNDLTGANGSDRSIKSSEIRSSPDTFADGMGRVNSATVQVASSLAFIIITTLSITTSVIFFDPFY